MRLLYCVPRYGAEVVGGAEGAARAFAEQMAARGHRVEVLTSCATDYVTWADDYPPGEVELNGVLVHRLAVQIQRRPEQFDPLSHRVLTGGGAALGVERDWFRCQGPVIEGLETWLERHAPRFDVAVFYPYLYAPTVTGLPVAARHTATVLHPAAHDEPMIELNAVGDPFRAADGISVQTPEEAATLERRFGAGLRFDVVGLGVTIDPPLADGRRFRDRFGLGDEPLLTYVGRVEPGKGVDELARYFVASKERLGHPFKLALVGPLVQPPPTHPDVVMTGLVDDQVRWDALAASHSFAMPSYFESFSIALCEAWALRLPAFVNANCATLAGQARRSGGGLGYRNYREFERSFVRLTGDDSLRGAMGERARSYVTRNYRWTTVLDRYERVLCDAIERHRARGGVPLRNRVGGCDGVS